MKVFRHPVGKNSREIIKFWTYIFTTRDNSLVCLKDLKNTYKTFGITTSYTYRATLFAVNS